MKKLNEKGFTLIELLAVIVILAILMITAIPAVTNSIAISIKDTFATNAKNVINAVRTSMASGDVKNGSEECSYPADGSAVKITITADALKGLLERGGDKSSFGRAYYANSQSSEPKTGYVIITNTNDKFTYSISLIDSGLNGIKGPVLESTLSSSDVKLGSVDGLPSESSLGITGDSSATTTKCYIN